MTCIVQPVSAAIKIDQTCYYGSDSAIIHLQLKGEITQSDVNALQRRIDMATSKLQSDNGYASLITSPDGEAYCNAKNVYIWATLNSIGGSVEAALRLGEIIRSTNSRIMVQDGDICYSSCVLVLAAGSRRYIERKAKIGIHRPFFGDSLNVSDAAMEETYRRLTVRIESYLRQSGVLPQLATEMMRTPPEQVQILTRAELNHYGLATDNVAVQEADAMREAARYGISRKELLIRRQNVPRICGPEPCSDRANMDACFRWIVCKDSVLRNR